MDIEHLKTRFQRICQEKCENYEVFQKDAHQYFAEFIPFLEEALMKAKKIEPNKPTTTAPTTTPKTTTSATPKKATPTAQPPKMYKRIVAPTRTTKKRK